MTLDTIADAVWWLINEVASIRQRLDGYVEYPMSVAKLRPLQAAAQQDLWLWNDAARRSRC